MRATKVPDAGPKRKLLDAAESLVAANGFDSVSVRHVTGAAGANVASVNYHYGSREGLMDMVIARILGPLCAERAKALENAGKSPHAGDLVRAYVAALPLVASATGMDGSLFTRLAGRILALSDEALPPVLAAARRDVSARYMQAITRGAKARESDWAFFEAGIAQSLIAATEGAGMDALLEDWIAFGLRGLAVADSPEKEDEDLQGMLFDF